MKKDYERSVIGIKSIFKPMLSTIYLSEADKLPSFISRKLLYANESIKKGSGKINGTFDIAFLVYTQEAVEEVIRLVGSRGKVIILPKLSSIGGSNILSSYFYGSDKLPSRLLKESVNIRKENRRERLVYSPEFIGLYEKYRNSIRNMVNEHSVKAIFITGMVGIYESAILELSVEMGFKVFCSQHGFYSELYPDKTLLKNVIFFASGEEEKYTLVRYGIKPVNIFITGSPFFDKISRYRKKNDSKSEKTITILSVPVVEDGCIKFSDYFNFIRSLFSKISKIENCKVLLKMHPREKYLKEYGKIIQSVGLNAKIIQSPEKEHLYSAISQSDLVIGFDSTADIEALMMGKNVVEIDIRKNSVDYEFKKSTIWIKNKQIEKTISTNLFEKALNDEKLKLSLNKKRENYVRKNFFMIDGKASERVAKIMMKILK